jgi:hypothetical protein
MFVRLPAEGPGVKDVRKRCSNIFGGLASLLIIGDWVMAISHAPMPIGYRQTLFTSHAPTILREIVKFDKELDTALKLGGIPPVESRAAGKQCPMKRWARW